MSLLDIEHNNIPETIIKDVIRKHFQFWIDRFPRLNGIVFDELMNTYTEEDWQFFIDKPNKTHIYWWDNYEDLRICICRQGIRPKELNCGYVRYTGHTNLHGYSYTLRKMINNYESVR